MLTTMLNAMSNLIGAVLRFWLNMITVFVLFIFLPMVLLWLAFFVIWAERAGQTPFWR